MRNYRDLKVWQAALRLAVDVCRTLESFPKYEQYGICSQIRRSAVSIPSNIAEGHQRDSTKEFLQFLSIARGSLAELETQILIAQELGYFTLEHGNSFLARTSELLRMIQGLQAALRRRLAK
jgi:four helix bundle protein